MKYLIIGASGQVGRLLMRLLRRQDPVGTTHTRPCRGLVRLDLADSEAVKQLIFDLKPDGIFVPGGVTAVDWCEKNEAQARRVCVEGTAAVCEAAARVGCHAIHFSTDYVFSGRSGPYREEDTPDPINAYGRVKAEAERAVTRGAILRTSMVYSDDPDSKNFHNFVRATLTAGQEVRAFADQSGSPTYAPALAKAAVEAMERRLAGLWHIAGPEVLTRLEWAQWIARAYGLNEGLIRPVTGDALALPAPRPRQGGLCIDKARTTFSAPFAPLCDALREMS
ncbi:MAG: SDR family oxidoreductase [Planctomycetes bacterium]|nr:SDR family oxidoreductase [Planctomycetota bacterium]